MRVEPMLPWRAAAAVDSERIHRQENRLKGWLRATGVKVESATARSGTFREQVAERTQQVGADLIVIGTDRAILGTEVTALARAVGMPVLLLRELDATVAPRILAATDLTCPQYPVLRKAAQLARGLAAAALLAVHNVDPVVGAAPFATWPGASLPEGGAVRSRRLQLSEASRRLAVELDGVITSDPDPIQAIVREAHAQQADLIVVGTRRVGILDRLLSRNVAAGVVNRARSSVLVTPLLPEA
jgi:nucleotide-binding universal stress UspA family protein